MANTIKAVVKNRRDTAVDLSTDNLIPYEGEITFESDTLRFKVGDGVTPYNTLPYSSENSINGYVVENIADAVDVIETLPDATTYKGEYTVKRRGAGLGKVLFATVSGQTIDGNPASEYELGGENSIAVLFPFGGNWIVKEYENTKQQCKAWVNFNGVTGVIRDSYNVSSITKNGTGDYTLNFTKAMNNSDYAVSLSTISTSALNTARTALIKGIDSVGPTLKTTTQLGILTGSTAATLLIDMADISCLIFGS